MKGLFHDRAVPLWLGGVLVGILLMFFAEIPLQISAGIFVILLVIGVWIVPKWRAWRKKVVGFCLFAVLGACSASIALAALPQESYSQVLLSGKISSLTQSDTDGTLKTDESDYATIYLEECRADGRKLDGKIEVRLTHYRAGEWRIGDVLSMRADLIPYRLNVTQYNSVRGYRDGLRYFCVLADSADVDASAGSLHAADAIRLTWKKMLARSCDDDTAAFLYAMTFGDSAGMSGAVKSTFSITGTAHLFAVSGLHVGILAVAILLILKKCRPWIKTAICIPILLVYCWLCDFAPSTLRATLMTAIALTARMLGRRNDPFGSVSLAAVLLLTIDPIALFDLGFQMSFFAVFGLIWLGGPIERVLTRVAGRFPKKLLRGIAASLAVNAALLPLLLGAFEEVSLVFLLSNLIAIPWVTALFPVYLISGVAACLIPFLDVAVTLLSVPFALLMRWIAFCAKLSVIAVGLPVRWYLVAPYLATMLMLSDFCMIERKFKRITAVVLCAVCIGGALPSLKGAGRSASAIYCYTDRYGRQAALFKADEIGNYLIVDGTFDEECARASAEVMNKRMIGVIDGLIVTDPSGIESALHFAVQLGIQEIFFANADAVDLSRGGARAYSLKLTDRMTIWFESASVCRIRADGFDLVIAPPDADADAVGDYDLAIGGYAEGSGYRIDQKGYEASLPNCMPSQFTFYLKDGKIIKIPAWSFR